MGFYLSAGQEAVDGEPLVGEVAVLEAGDAVPVGAAVAQQLGESQQLRPQLPVTVLRLGSIFLQ